MLYLKEIILLGISFILQFQGVGQLSCTKFPKSVTMDYNVQDFQAKVALPADDQLGRVWVKGTPNMNWYKLVQSSGETKGPFVLTAPNYTDLQIVKAGQVEVFFSQTNFKFEENKKISLHVPDKIDFEKEEPFALVFYGCFEPFEINKKTGVASVAIGKNNSNYEMRKLFKAVCLNEPVSALVQPRREDSVYEYKDGNTETQPLLKPVRMVIGTGDQVYVDAGYANQKKKTDISTWQISRRPMPLVTSDCYRDHLNRMYQHFGSFGLLNQVFHKIPSAAVIDDHEIRDGWGSQGDEYFRGSMNPRLIEYYMHSRRAYADHQLALGPHNKQQISKLKNNNEPMHQQFKAGSKRVFMFDLRSNRDMHKQVVINRQQFDAFADWINASQQNEEVIIVTSIPLFLGYKALNVRVAKAWNSELADDITDGWDSKANQDQRNQIISLILKNRIEKKIKPFIVSGDVHSGGIMEVWYSDAANATLCTEKEREKRKVLCYELVATGLNHETLTKENPGLLGIFMSSQKKRSQKHWSNENLIQFLEPDEKVFPMNNTTYRISTVSRIDEGTLNFGAIEFSGNSTNIHIYLHNKVKPIIEEFIVQAEWDKLGMDDKKYMQINRNDCKIFNYNAPLSQIRKTINTAQ